jgi:hypothetical protein
MKGLVFTTFFDFCQSRHGPDLLDDAIERAALPHGGAYTSVGTYPFQEMVALVTAVAQLSTSSLPATLEEFGEHCFAAWVNKFPATFAGKDLFEVLCGIDNFHETEVRKLYPDAELPSFTVISRDARQLVLHYRSCKPLADLAVGVIRGASVYLGTPVEIGYHALGEVIEFQVSRAVARTAA